MTPWAARPESAVAIWSIRMAPRATWTLPPAPRGVNRTLYVFAGGLLIGTRAITLPPRSGSSAPIDAGTAARLLPDVAATLSAGDEPADALLLQGRPIGEPVAQHGPFVMTSPLELRQAFTDYQRTRYGGWPWPSGAPVHGRDQGRFAKQPGGAIVTAPAPSPGSP